MKRMTKLGLLAATLATVWGSALADINVGVVVSATGPAASRPPGRPRRWAFPKRTRWR